MMEKIIIDRSDKEMLIKKEKSETMIDNRIISDIDAEKIIILEEKSRLDYCIIGSHAKITKIRFILKKDSILNIYSFDTDNGSDINVILEDEGSKVNINSIYYSISDIRLKATVSHDAPNTHSVVSARGIAKGSKAMINSMIHISPMAQGSSGYEISDALIVGDGKIISLPNLEIHNNDVKCSHSSSITRLDDEKLFYMQSRGIGEDECRQMMIEGFYWKSLEKIDDPKIKEMITGQITKNLEVHHD